MFIWVQLEYTLDGHCLGRKTFPIGREPPSSMCFASWFPPCWWDVFLIRKKHFSHRQGGNRKQGSNTHCGRQLPVYGGNLSASSKQGASKQPANKQQQAASKQPASSQPASRHPAASKQPANKQQQAASQQQASSKPAASRQQASKKQAASRKIPSFFGSMNMVATYWNSAHIIMNSKPLGSQCKQCFFTTKRQYLERKPPKFF